MKLADVAVLQQERNGLTAAAGPPLVPSRAWFEREEPDEPTGWTVTADGQVWGHAAVWGTCHTGKPGRCVTPPKSRSKYAYYQTGLTEVDDGELIPTGRITLGTGHANLTASPAATAEHYDNTGAVVADVTVKDGKHGVWVTGALRPNVSPERIRELRGASLSGDWRSIRGALEMLGLLAVNVPGFPVPRAMTASGENDEVLAMVAAGMLDEEDEVMEVADMSEEEFGEELDALYASSKKSSDRYMKRQQKIAEVMREFKAGKLKSSSGDKVTSRKQALAIAFSKVKALKADGEISEEDANEITEALEAAEWIEEHEALEAAAFDEAKHPRHQKGSNKGGEFAPKGGDVASPSETPDPIRSHSSFASARDELADKFLDVYTQDRNAGGSHKQALSLAEHEINSSVDLQEWFAEDELAEMLPDEDPEEQMDLEPILDALIDDAVAKAKKGIDPKYMKASADPDDLPAAKGVPRDALEAAGTFDESKHPRHAKGSTKGGEFAPKGGGVSREGGDSAFADNESYRDAVSSLSERYAATYIEARGGGAEVNAAHEQAASELDDLDLQEFFAEDELYELFPNVDPESGDEVDLDGLRDSLVTDVEDAASTLITAEHGEVGRPPSSDFKADWDKAREDEKSDDPKVAFEAREKLARLHELNSRDREKYKRGMKASADPNDLPAARGVPQEPADGAVPAASLTASMRAAIALMGEAMPDGSWVIRNRAELLAAITASAGAGAEVCGWIATRAHELGVVGDLPATWDLEVLQAAGTFDESKHPRHQKGKSEGGQFAPKGGGSGGSGKGAMSNAAKAAAAIRKVPEDTEEHDVAWEKHIEEAADAEGVDFDEMEARVMDELGEGSRAKEPEYSIVDTGREGFRVGVPTGSGRKLVEQKFKTEREAQAFIKEYRRKGLQASGFFDESKHPRHPKGVREGGRFTVKEIAHGAKGEVVFARKPTSVVEEVLDTTEDFDGEGSPVEVRRQVKLTPEEFDKFDASPLADRPEWFADTPLPRKDEAGVMRDSVVEVTDGERTVWVDTQGYDYARYIAKPPLNEADFDIDKERADIERRVSEGKLSTSEGQQLTEQAWAAHQRRNRRET